MEKELLALFAMSVLGFAVFGRFESHSPWWRSILKWAATLGIIWAISKNYGHNAALYTILGMTIVSVIIHFMWCYKNGIHPIAATPRKKYYELRGWPWIE